MTVRAVTGAAVALTAAVLPVFLVGALATQMQRELGFGETALGAVVTGFFLAGAVSAYPGGRLVERTDARRAIIAGVTGTAAAGILIAVWVSAWWQLLLVVAAAGTTLGLVDPGGARLFSDAVAADRQGRAFGLKEASVPAASLVAGIVLPAAAGALGWRPVFLLPLAAVPVVWVVLPRTTGRRGPPMPARAPSPALPTGALAVVSVGTAFGAAAATSMAAFLVPAADTAALTLRSAGALLAGGSVAAAATRLAVGAVADRRRRPPFALVATMMVGGAAGLLLLAAAGQIDGGAAGVAWLLGTLLGFAAGWGWTGLMFLAVVRAGTGAPAAAAGVVLTGLGVGGALGPLGFGQLADSFSFAAAWLAAAASAGVGGVLVAVGDQLLRRRGVGGRPATR